MTRVAALEKGVLKTGEAGLAVMMVLVIKKIIRLPYGPATARNTLLFLPALSCAFKGR